MPPRKSYNFGIIRTFYCEKYTKLWMYFFRAENKRKRICRLASAHSETSYLDWGEQGLTAKGIKMG